MSKKSGISRQGEDDSAASRRDQVVEAAVAVFAEHGYYRATTAQVAARVGISQPYIFKLFKNKEELFTAALMLAFDRLLSFFSGLKAPKKKLLDKALQLYKEFTRTHADEVILQMQAASIREAAIRQVVQVRMLEFTRLMEGKFTAAGFARPEVKLSIFMADVMLGNMALALDLPELTPQQR
ncbi:helix-turn-helix domain-containing protein [Paenibacillus sp. FSL K6-1096]|uniref:TetR/AcrR family transcriptional regulator n=1 Tax=Paenibacillus sp. FSL K6-1096 TaxID=2921460 RepID=UPI0030EF30EC